MSLARGMGPTAASSLSVTRRGGRQAACSFPISRPAGVAWSYALRVQPEDDDLQPEYDFSNAVRGKYYQRYQDGSNVILLDADVARTFKDSESVNRALRLLLELAQREVPPPR